MSQRSSRQARARAAASARAEALSILFKHPPVIVARAEGARIRSGRPWVSRDRLMEGLHGLPAGSIVEIFDSMRKWLGRGFVEPAGPTAVRIATVDPRRALDAEWIGEVIWQAWDRRKKLGLTTGDGAFRLLNAEGDGAPGLVIDAYAGHFAGWANIPAWHAYETRLAHVLKKLPGYRGFGWKRAPGTGEESPEGDKPSPLFLGEAAAKDVEGDRRRHAAMNGRTTNNAGRVRSGAIHGATPAHQSLTTHAQREGALSGDKARAAPEGGGYVHVHGIEPPDDLTVMIDGLRLFAGIKHGKNTGLFLDQRENRRRIAELCADQEVCNAFCYTGAFSVAAALSGARKVVSIDMARRAVTVAKRNFELNGIDPASHAFIVEDVFDAFERWAGQRRSFDIVIIDPPSFAKGSGRVFSASQHYGELVALASRICAPGGKLIASCPTANWPFSAFAHALHMGARAAGRTLRILGTHGLPPDFPIPEALPELDYLKFAIAAV